MVVESQAPRRLRAATEIAASPAQVWRVVSDVRRTGEWSPECVRVIPVRGWLLGVNRRQRVWWATLSRVVEHQPNRVISWVVKTNGAQWTYRLSPVEGGTRLEQTRETPGGVKRVAGWFTRSLLGGQAVHDEELEAGMASGLQRIKAIVEAQPQA